jgi:magnesium transporter
MLKAIHCDMQDQAFRHLSSLDQARALKSSSNSLLWIDLQSPSEQELVEIGQEFNLHPLAIEDAFIEHQRPKVEEYEQFYFVVFYSVSFNDQAEGLNISEVDMFLGQNFLITVHNEHILDLDEVEQRWTRNVKQLEWGIGVLLYTLLDTIVDHYFPVVDAMVNQAEQLEDHLFAGVLRQAAFAQEMLSLRKRFLALRRIATPERDIFITLTHRDSSIFDVHVLVYFRDIYDHITRLADTIDLYRDQLSTIMEANLSLASNDLNKIMRTLTAASIILMADALLAGIWGMNYENMPELHWQYGYYIALFLMLLVAFVLYNIFKRLRWF